MAFDFDRIKTLEKLSEDECVEKIKTIRSQYGKKICLLAHLYQRKKIADLADYVGDSYGLSLSASKEQEAEYIIFCGVRFMAETAAILAKPHQKVLHPDPEAGCPMADMASESEVKRAWSFFQNNQFHSVMPITYMNSTADIKSFCGENEGTICTSSNAHKVFAWAYAQKQKIFFLPDEHLGRNTALKYGIEASQIAIWDPEKENGGEDLETYQEAKVILWRGHCPVHQKFTVRDIEHVRQFYPKAKIIVHPECPSDVVAKSDAVGSTEFIRQYVAKETKAGDQLFIGTEINMIQNLASQYPDRMITKLHRSLCLTMYQITLGRLLYTLENLETFEKVVVPESVKHFSKVAIDRMFLISK